MITKWHLSNFKSIRKDTSLALAPLTILAGPNSSGKSSLIQSLLLVSQTLSHKMSSRSVVLNGALARMGQFDDLRSFNGSSDQIVIGWECEPAGNHIPTILDHPQAIGRRSQFYGRGADRPKQVSCEFAFDADPNGVHGDIAQLNPRLFKSSISCQIAEGDGPISDYFINVIREQSYDAKISRLKVNVPENDLARIGMEYEANLDAHSMREIRDDLVSATPAGCIMNHCLPSRILLRVNRAEEDARFLATVIFELGARRTYRRMTVDQDVVIPPDVVTLLRESVGPAFTELFVTQQAELMVDGPVSERPLTLKEWFDRIRALSANQRNELLKALREKADLYEGVIKLARKAQPDSYSLTFYRLPDALMNAAGYTDFLFSTMVKYLGPLRDEPKPLYPLAATVDPFDVGLRGEFTAAVLNLHKDRRIRYIQPNALNEYTGIDISATATLEVAVTEWLQYFGVAEAVQTTDLGKLGHELKVLQQGVSKPHDLTHVGVGVSQVLPILVTCLLAESDTTLVVEQPELHLHPKVQTLLGDFFLSIGLLGKQCIIETHSEYLISRLRYRAAKAPDGVSLASKMKMYFVEKQDDSAIFREVVVNDYGAIIDWPEGFFDQGQREADIIMRAAVDKKRRGKPGGGGNA